MIAPTKVRIRVQYWADQLKEGDFGLSCTCPAVGSRPIHRFSSQTPHEDIQEWHHVVYECYSSDEAPLYVGLSKNLRKRLLAHRSTSPWLSDVESLAIMFVPCIAVARRFEWHRIKELRPVHNRARNPDWDEKLRAYRPQVAS